MSHIFHEPFEAAVHARRGFSPPAAAPPFSQARRLAWTQDEAWTAVRRRFAPILAGAGNDMGRSAALTVTVTGQGDDPYLNLALAIGAGQGLAVDQALALAVEILASFAGQSAARIV